MKGNQDLGGPQVFFDDSISMSRRMSHPGGFI
jgi:hypothetical protein